MNFQNYLNATYYLDCDNPIVIDYVKQRTINCKTQKEKAIALYYWVRDTIAYNSYNIVLEPSVFKASYILTKKSGYCVEKSNLYAPCLRVCGIPTRMAYANVRNHLGTKKLEERLGTDLLVFHSYVEAYLGNKWIKITPIFDEKLCQKLGVGPLPFDGEKDSVFQASDKVGNPFMEYVTYHGYFADFPFEIFIENLKLYYSHLFEKKNDSLCLLI